MNKVFSFVSIAASVLVSSVTMNVNACNIPANLYYDYPIDLLSQDYSRQISNKDIKKATTKEIVNPVDGLRYGIFTTYSEYTYKVTDHKTNLNLETGVVTKTNGSAQTSIYPPEQGGDIVEFVTTLKEMKERVDYVHHGRYLPEETNNIELSQTNEYLNSIIKQYDNYTPDQINCPVTSMELYPGKIITIRFDTWSQFEREILIDLFVDSKFISNKRVVVPAGQHNYNYVNFTIPSNIATNKSADIYTKILPVGAPWQSFTAEHNIEAVTKPLNHISSIDSKNYVIMNATNNYEVFYKIDQPLTTSWEIRLDIIDLNGTWKTGVQVPVNNNGYASIPLYVANILERGKTYDLYYKLIPVGGNWWNFVDQKFLKVIAQ
jgi:hypothetical protein